MNNANRDTVPDGLIPPAPAPAGGSDWVSTVGSPPESARDLRAAAAPPSPAASTRSADTGSAGSLLRAAREQAGLHIGALAVSLKVPVAKLEALEDGSLERSTSPVFVRALAASVCRHLKVDAEPILARLPQPISSPLKKDEDLDAPFPSGGSHAITTFLPFNWRSPIVLAVLALLLAALALVYWPRGSSSFDLSGTPTPHAASDGVAGGAPAPAGMVQTPVESAAGANPSSGAGAPAAGAAMAGEGTAAGAANPPSNPSASGASVPALSPTPGSPTSSAASGATVPSTLAATPPAAPVANASMAAQPASGVAAAALTGAEPLALRAVERSWVEVTDARGAVVLRKTLEAGEVVTPGGTLPLRVTVGNARGTTVLVRGQAFDLTPVTRESVARFDVK